VDVEIIIPRQGQTMTEATIQKWFKKDGDTVNEDEELLEIMTDKVTVVIDSPATGLLKITAQEDETIPVYGVIGYVMSEK
jgi:pyruvate/2-oxoglutarate dehydrogenase complex dihydrolipoamide acyltransferase (E2) component